MALYCSGLRTNEPPPPPPSAAAHSTRPVNCRIGADAAIAPSTLDGCCERAQCHAAWLHTVVVAVNDGGRGHLHTEPRREHAAVGAPKRDDRARGAVVRRLRTVVQIERSAPQFNSRTRARTLRCATSSA